MKLKKKITVTISREFGSGGREVGERLAGILEIPFYDRNILNEISGKCGISVDELARNDERVITSLKDTLLPYDFESETLSEKLFDMQAELILDKVQKESCVIVGRCSDVILEYQEDVINVYIYAEEEDKLHRTMELYGITEEQKAAKFIKKTEKIRKNYYQYFTDEIWGSKSNKDLMINTTKTGIEGAVELMLAYLQIRGYAQQE